MSEYLNCSSIYTLECYSAVKWNELFIHNYLKGPQEHFYGVQKLISEGNMLYDPIYAPFVK